VNTLTTLPHAAAAPPPPPPPKSHELEYKLSDETVQREVPPPVVLYRKDIDYPGIFSLFRRALGQFVILLITSSLAGWGITAQSKCGGVLENDIVRDLVDLVLAFTTIFVGSRVSGSLLRFNMDMGWYHRSLKKPSWTPPPKVFPLVWTPLFTMQALAYYFIWKAVDRQALSAPIVIFLAHKTFGGEWLPVDGGGGGGRHGNRR